MTVDELHWWRDTFLDIRDHQNWKQWNTTACLRNPMYNLTTFPRFFSLVHPSDSLPLYLFYNNYVWDEKYWKGRFDFIRFLFNPLNKFYELVNFNQSFKHMKTTLTYQDMTFWGLSCCGCLCFSLPNQKDVYGRLYHGENNAWYDLRQSTHRSRQTGGETKNVLKITKYW